jgi:hypothetical protein
VSTVAAAGLPAYTGPEGHCPRCGVPGAVTEWHWAVPPPPRDGGRRPPCAGHVELAVWDGKGEHLCRVCLNCGYGWSEACTDPAATPPNTPMPPGAIIGLFSLAASVVSTGAGGFLSPLLGGPALVAAWLAVTVAFSFALAAWYGAVAGRTSKRKSQ